MWETRSGSIPALGRSPGEGNGYPLQYSYLGNFMDRGAWRATVHGVAKNHMGLSNSHVCFVSFSAPRRGSSQCGGLRVKFKVWLWIYHLYDLWPVSHLLWASIFLGLPRWLSGKELTCQCRRHRGCGFKPCVRKIPGGGSRNPPQYFFLENPVDRGAWVGIVHGVAKSQTWLNAWTRTRTELS